MMHYVVRRVYAFYHLHAEYNHYISAVNSQFVYKCKNIIQPHFVQYISTDDPIRFRSPPNKSQP